MILIWQEGDCALYCNNCTDGHTKQNNITVCWYWTHSLLTLSLYQTSIGEIYGWESDAQKSIWKGQKEGDEWTVEDTNEYLQIFVQ